MSIEFRVGNLPEPLLSIEAIQVSSTTEADRPVRDSGVLRESEFFRVLSFAAKSSTLSDGSTIIDVEFLGVARWA